MNSTSIKLVGIIAGAILVIGVLMIGAQYFERVSSGASAAIDEAILPANLSVSKEDYIRARGLMDEYANKNELAGKNRVFQELSELVVSWEKQ